MQWIVRYIVCAIALAHCMVLAADPGMVVSRFDSGADGWFVASFKLNGRPVRKADVEMHRSNDRHGGYIATEDIDGETTFVMAPEKFRQPAMLSYGGRLTFDMRTMSRERLTGRPFGFQLVFLRSGRTILIYPVPPAVPSWTSRVVPMHEEGWRTLDGKVVTDNMFLSVLSSLDMLGIQAETNHGDVRKEGVAFDNIMLEVRPPETDPAIGLPRQ